MTAPVEIVVQASPCTTCNGRGWDLVRPIGDDPATQCPGCHGRGCVVEPLPVPMVECDHRDCRSADSIEHGYEWACNHWQTDDMRPDRRWLRLGEPCDTCNGEGEVEDTSEDDSMWGDGLQGASSPWLPCPAPDCVGGRLTVPIVRACSVRWREGWGHDPMCREPECDSGKIVVGWCSFTLAPVVKPYGLAWTGKPYVSVNSDGAAIIGLPGAVGPVPLNFEVSPGMVVAIPHIEDES